MEQLSANEDITVDDYKKWTSLNVYGMHEILGLFEYLNLPFPPNFTNFVNKPRLIMTFINFYTKD